MPELIILCLLSTGTEVAGGSFGRKQTLSPAAPCSHHRTLGCETNTGLVARGQGTMNWASNLGGG